MYREPVLSKALFQVERVTELNKKLKIYIEFLGKGLEQLTNC